MLCKGCGSDKDPSLFYKSNRATCIDCVKSRARVNRLNNIERVTLYEKSRSKDPKRVEARKVYQTTSQGIERCNAAKLKYQESNAKKRSVHIKVGNAIRDGILMKEPCSVCQTTDNIVAHHCDYDRPFDVMWLCAQHHSDWHAINGEGLNA